jgi:hypothetical protein
VSALIRVRVRETIAEIDHRDVPIARSQRCDDMACVTVPTSRRRKIARDREGNAARYHKGAS